MPQGEGLEVSGLRKDFGGIRAVDGISFRAGPGEFVSLLGPSGCGKTTTLRCIAGFEHPQGGRITLDGVALTDAATGTFTPPHRRRFGMVFQSYAVWPHMTVFDNVAYPLKVQGGVPRAEIAERVRAKLAMVGLSGLEERHPGRLSGGQQQRVALARAIVMEPHALLFDEPLSNLDAKLRERMRFELIEVQRRLGVPAVYVTHDQTEAMVMSDRILVMEKGVIAQEGRPEDIYTRPANTFVADFIGLCNFVEAEVLSAAGAGRWQVHSALGTHICVGDMPLSVGKSVTLMIRPERIGLVRAPAADTIAVEVRHRYFLGAFCEYQLAVGAVTLRAQVTDPVVFPIGEKVFASIAPEDCRVVRRDANPPDEVPPTVAAGRR